MHKRRVAAATLAATAAIAATAAAAPLADVTLRVDRTYDDGNNLYRYRFTGTIASDAAGEYVAIEARKCGENHWVSTLGASTQAGGSYRIVTNTEPDFKNLTVWPPAAYRARWKDDFSEPVTIRGDLFVRLQKVRHLRYRATVMVSSTTPLKLRGRPLEVQRITAGRWGRIATVRFAVARRDSFSTTYTATFSVPARASLRVVVGEKTVAPCYNEVISKTWRTK